MSMSLWMFAEGEGVVLATNGVMSGPNQLLFGGAAVLLAGGVFYTLRRLHQSEKRWEAEDDIARQVREIEVDLRLDREGFRDGGVHGSP